VYIGGELSQDNTHRFPYWNNLLCLTKIIQLLIVSAQFLCSLFSTTSFLLFFPLVCSTRRHTLHEMIQLFGYCTHNPNRCFSVQHSNYFNVIQHNCTIVKMEAPRFSETSVTSHQSQHLHTSAHTISTSRTYLKPQTTSRNMVVLLHYVTMCQFGNKEAASNAGSSDFFKL